jgi:excisionase family DNA binding protein
MASTALPPRLLTIPQAAEYLSATVWYVRTLLWHGTLPFVRAGKRHLIDIRDLDRFVDHAKEVSHD